MTLKTEVTQLHKEIEEVQINQLRLKAAKHFINKYSSMVIDCKVYLTNALNFTSLSIKYNYVNSVEIQQ